MQTFLCEPTFSLSVAHLDNKRLGKQRVEAYQILLALDDNWAWSVYTGKKERGNYGWRNHPVVRMWSQHIDGLKIYYNCCLTEWKRKGFVNNMPFAPEITMSRGLLYMSISWFNNDFVTAHRCKLLQKDYDFYSKYNWSVPTNWREVDYIWPV